MTFNLFNLISSENVALGSTMNSVGQTAGYFLGYVLFLALESAEFCNKYLRSIPSDFGVVTLPGFLFFWGVVFMITTTLVMAKHEKNDDDSDITVFETYKLLGRIVSLRKVQKLVLFLFTCKIGFAATDAVTPLKLVEYGIPKAKLALLAVPMTPVQIVLPLLISKYTKDRPLNMFIKALPVRLVMGAVFMAIVEWTKHVVKNSPGGEPGAYYYVVVVVVSAFHQVALYTMFVSIMSFFSQVSDPTVGGTYMTLLNTICNLGGNWPTTVALWFVDPLTTKVCEGDASNDCSSTALEKVLIS